MHGTQGRAAELERPCGTTNALASVPQYLRQLDMSGVAWLGLVGALVALSLLYAEAVAPAAVVALGLAGFVVLGVAGLPVLMRYLIIPACLLALFAAVATLGWTRLPPGSDTRRWWMIGAVAAAIVLLAGA